MSLKRVSPYYYVISIKSSQGKKPFGWSLKDILFYRSFFKKDSIVGIVMSILIQLTNFGFFSVNYILGKANTNKWIGTLI